jgi:hypothetical protein
MKRPVTHCYTALNITDREILVRSLEHVRHLRRVTGQIKVSRLSYVLQKFIRLNYQLHCHKISIDGVENSQ